MASAAVQKTNDTLVHDTWRAFRRGVNRPGDEPFAEIMKNRVKALYEWAESQPNRAYLNSLLGRVQDDIAPKDRVARACGLLELVKSLETTPIRDALIDQTQDDLNIAFDTVYVLNLHGLRDISGLFNEFVNGYNALNKQVFKDRFHISKYYLISTTLTAQNTETMRTIEPLVAKESCDQLYITIFEAYAASNDTAKLASSLSELATSYEQLLKSPSFPVSDQLALQDSIRECKKYAALISILENSPLAQKEFATLRAKINDLAKDRRPMKSNNSSMELLLYAFAAFLLLAVIALIYRSKIVSNTSASSSY
jgi:hypothetical protein